MIELLFHFFVISSQPTEVLEQVQSLSIECAEKVKRVSGRKGKSYSPLTKENIPRVLLALHKAGISLGSYDVEKNKSEEFRRVVESVVGKPLSGGSLRVKTIEHFGSWKAVFDDPILIQAGIRFERQKSQESIFTKENIPLVIAHLHRNGISVAHGDLSRNSNEQVKILISEIVGERRTPQALINAALNLYDNDWEKALRASPIDLSLVPRKTVLRKDTVDQIIKSLAQSHHPLNSHDIYLDLMGMVSLTVHKVTGLSKSSSRLLAAARKYYGTWERALQENGVDTISLKRRVNHVMKIAPTIRELTENASRQIEAEAENLPSAQREDYKLKAKQIMLRLIPLASLRAKALERNPQRASEIQIEILTATLPDVFSFLSEHPDSETEDIFYLIRNSRPLHPIERSFVEARLKDFQTYTWAVVTKKGLLGLPIFGRLESRDYSSARQYVDSLTSEALIETILYYPTDPSRFSTDEKRRRMIQDPMRATFHYLLPAVATRVTQKLISSSQKSDVKRKVGQTVDEDSLSPVETARSKEASPDYAALGSEIDSALKIKLAVALTELPPRLREPLIMMYFKGMTVEKIAAALNEPSQGTVKSLLFRARARLREILGASPLTESDEDDEDS